MQKTNANANSLLNSIYHQTDIDGIYAKIPYEAKYQLLINKRESVGSKHCILYPFLNTRMIWMMFMIILIITIQIKNAKH